MVKDFFTIYHSNGCTVGYKSLFAAVATFNNFYRLFDMEVIDNETGEVYACSDNGKVTVYNLPEWYLKDCIVAK